MKLTTGLRLRSQVCTTEVVIIKPGNVDVALTCGGRPLIGQKDTPEPGLGLDPKLSTGSQLGKRYTDATGTLELLVSKQGDGTLTHDDQPLLRKESQPLPASD